MRYVNTSPGPSTESGLATLPISSWNAMPMRFEDWASDGGFGHVDRLAIILVSEPFRSPA